MGESASARTERELAELRARIDADIRALEGRLREDVDPRRLVRRNPIAVFGAVGSTAAVAVVGVLRRLSARSPRPSEADLATIINSLGGRAGRLSGAARKRFHEALRHEMGEAGAGPRWQRAALEAVSSALTAALTLVAQRFASRLIADEELPAAPDRDHRSTH